jgi:hypothetical protein
VNQYETQSPSEKEGAAAELRAPNRRFETSQGETEHRMQFDRVRRDASLPVVTFTSFGSARDLPLAELTTAAFYPADAQSADALTVGVSEAQPT